MYSEAFIATETCLLVRTNRKQFCRTSHLKKKLLIYWFRKIARTDWKIRKKMIETCTTGNIVQ